MLKNASANSGTESSRVCPSPSPPPPAPRGSREASLDLLVVVLQRLLGDRHSRLHAGARQLEIFQIHGFGNSILRLVRVVPLLHLRIGELYLVIERAAGNQHVIDFALLLLERVAP